jgi:hypothetical protein
MMVQCTVQYRHATLLIDAGMCSGTNSHTTVDGATNSPEYLLTQERSRDARAS